LLAVFLPKLRKLIKFFPTVFVKVAKADRDKMNISNIHETLDK
jgi:hypothetical protein